MRSDDKKDVELERLSERIFSLFHDQLKRGVELFSMDIGTVARTLGPDISLERVNKALRLLEERELLVQLADKTGYKLTEKKGEKTSPSELVAQRLQSELDPLSKAWRKKTQTWRLWVIAFGCVSIAAVMVFYLRLIPNPIAALLALIFPYATLILIITRDSWNPRREVQLSVRMYRGYQCLFANEYTKAEKELRPASGLLRFVRVVGWPTITTDVRTLFKRLSDQIRSKLLGAITSEDKVVKKEKILPPLLRVIDQLTHPSLSAFERAVEELTPLEEYTYEPLGWWGAGGEKTWFPLIIALIDVVVSITSYFLIQSSYPRDAALSDAIIIALGIPVIGFAYRQWSRSVS